MVVRARAFETVLRLPRVRAGRVSRPERLRDVVRVDGARAARSGGLDGAGRGRTRKKQRRWNMRSRPRQTYGPPHGGPLRRYPRVTARFPGRSCALGATLRAPTGPRSSAAGEAPPARSAGFAPAPRLATERSPRDTVHGAVIEAVAPDEHLPVALGQQAEHRRNLASCPRRPARRAKRSPVRRPAANARSSRSARRAPRFRRLKRAAGRSARALPPRATRRQVAGWPSKGFGSRQQQRFRAAKNPGLPGLSLERLKGLEPSTFCMASRRSSQLSYSRAGRPV